MERRGLIGWPPALGLMLVLSACGGSGSNGDDDGGDADGGEALCIGATDEGDTEAEATMLGTIGDCDEQGSFVAGTLDGDDDTDWFTFEGTDERGCVTDGEARVIPPGGQEVCMFASCTVGTATEITCTAPATEALSPDGNAGCCGVANSGEVFVDCDGDDEGATLTVRIRSGAPGVCSEYTLLYHY